MNITDFTDHQKQALLDLSMLAMYADGHLAGAEDERVYRLLRAMGSATDVDHRMLYAASISRVSRHSQNAESARAYAATLAQSFPAVEQRRWVQATLDDVVTSDAKISSQESGFLSVIREVLEK